MQGSVLPWLLVTTTNCALNLRRATRRYDALLKKVPRTSNADDPAITYAQVDPVDDVDAQFGQALRAPKPLDLQLITLIGLEDYDLAAAATILHLTPGAARIRLHRARQRLREELPDLWIARNVTVLQEG